MEWGVLHTYIIASKNLKIRNLSGRVELRKKYRGVVRIGFAQVEVVDGKTNHSIWDNKGTIIFSGDAHLAAGAKIVVRGRLLFGDHFILNGDTSIIAAKSIEFGNDCLLSWGSTIMATDFHPIHNYNDEVINPNKEIVIGDRCWIGCNTLIKKGARLSSGSIVAAGSIVTKAHNEEHCIICNDKVVKENIKWSYEE